MSVQESEARLTWRFKSYWLFTNSSHSRAVRQSLNPFRGGKHPWNWSQETSYFTWLVHITSSVNFHGPGFIDATNETPSFDNAISLYLGHPGCLNQPSDRDLSYLRTLHV